MPDVLRDRDAMGLKPQAHATHGLQAHILQLLRLQLHLRYEVLLLAEVRNEGCQCRIELLIQFVLKES